MTDDLITRLRNHIAITTKIHYSPKDGYPEPVMVHGPSPICQEAADEIERLREALRIEQEELAACCIDRKETQRERDEARREICQIMHYTGYLGGDYANHRKWDCYKDGKHNPLSAEIQQNFKEWLDGQLKYYKDKVDELRNELRQKQELISKHALDVIAIIDEEIQNGS